MLVLKTHSKSVFDHLDLVPLELDLAGDVELFEDDASLLDELERVLTVLVLDNGQVHGLFGLVVDDLVAASYRPHFGHHVLDLLVSSLQCLGAGHHDPVLALVELPRGLVFLQPEVDATLASEAVLLTHQEVLVLLCNLHVAKSAVDILGLLRVDEVDV